MPSRKPHRAPNTPKTAKQRIRRDIKLEQLQRRTQQEQGGQPETSQQLAPGHNGTNQAEPRYHHVIENRISGWTQWPMVVVLTLIWGALWQDFGFTPMVTGLVLSLLVMKVFKLPPVPFADRFNLWYAIKFFFIFLWKITMATVHVARVVFFNPRGVNNAVIGVKLRSHDDLIVTLTGHAYALIPGSLVLDVDRATSTLYLHVIDIESEEDVESFRAESLSIEAHIIRAIGSKEDYALVKTEDAEEGDAIRRRLDPAGEEYTR